MINLSEHVCPLPPCWPLSKRRGGGWGGMDNELTEEGNTPPLPHPSGEGRTGTSPPQSSPIASKALLSPRPNSRAAHPYPRSDRGGEIGESRPHSPTTLSKRFLSGEGAGELSQTRKIAAGESQFPSCPAGLQQYFPVNESAHQLPYRGLRDPTRKLRSVRAGNRPLFIKVRRGPTGNFRSPTTRCRSHMPTLTRNGNKAAPMTSLAGTSAIQRGPRSCAGSALQGSPVC